MLDKFKLFGKDKGKDKGKSRATSAGTSKSKAGSTPGDRSSGGLPSPTGPPPDPPQGATGGASPKTQPKGLKKFGKIRKDAPPLGSVSREEMSGRRTSGGSGIPGSHGRAQSAGVSRTTSSHSVSRTASSNSVSSVTSSSNGNRRSLSTPGNKQVNILVNHIIIHSCTLLVRNNSRFGVSLLSYSDFCKHELKVYMEVALSSDKWGWNWVK